MINSYGTFGRACWHGALLAIFSAGAAFGANACEYPMGQLDNATANKLKGIVALAGSDKNLQKLDQLAAVLAQDRDRAMSEGRPLVQRVLLSIIDSRRVDFPKGLPASYAALAEAYLAPDRIQKFGTEAVLLWEVSPHESPIRCWAGSQSI